MKKDQEGCASPAPTNLEANGLALGLPAGCRVYLGGLRMCPQLGFEIFEAFEDGAYYQREGYRCVFQDFGKLAAFFAGDEFAPAYGFGVGAAAEAAPVDGFGTDADAVGVTLEGKIFVAAAGHEFSVDAKLLGPVAGNAATNG